MLTIGYRPVAGQPGLFNAEWKADAPGAYLIETIAKQGETELGRDVLTFQREDGVAENCRAEQNRELLERIATQTGGRSAPAGTGKTCRFHCRCRHNAARAGPRRAGHHRPYRRWKDSGAAGAA